MPRVVLLAFTKMRTGFCLAGADFQTHAWIRPVKEFGTIQFGDVHYADRQPFEVFDAADWTLTSSRPAPPHVEDRVCDFVRARPIRVETLTGRRRADFLEEMAERDTSCVTVRHERSLILTPVDSFTATFAYDAQTRKLDARILCPSIGLNQPTPVTDLRWRALARIAYAQTGGATLAWEEIRRDLKAERAYLALGLSREFDGKIWPLVVGVHCVPDYEIVPDLRNP
jgi:hypothetical protein